MDRHESRSDDWERVKVRGTRLDSVQRRLVENCAGKVVNRIVEGQRVQMKPMDNRVAQRFTRWR